ncbi:hypothetical protein F383_14892 [Gossypium arboreum]|uniref:Uncharacterized protein n=1 Tax=Gossypium arboreum TaxID=29729 RepID=A0A0B0MAS8_GOSAR|nr:hypothetical protein F383_14892 [Gossypium arboreum]
MCMKLNGMCIYMIKGHGLESNDDMRFTKCLLIDYLYIMKC